MVNLEFAHEKIREYMFYPCIALRCLFELLYFFVFCWHFRIWWWMQFSSHKRDQFVSIASFTSYIVNLMLSENFVRTVYCIRLYHIHCSNTIKYLSTNLSSFQPNTFSCSVFFFDVCTHKKLWIYWPSFIKSIVPMNIFSCTHTHIWIGTTF